MTLSAPYGVHGILLVIVVAVAAMIFVGRRPGARRLRPYAVGFALHLTRAILLFAEDGLGHIAAAAEIANAGVAAVLVAAMFGEVGRAPPWRMLAAAWLAAALWVAAATATLGIAAAALPVQLVVGGVMMATAVAFWRRAEAAPEAGFRLVALLFALWAVHEWDASLLGLAAHNNPFVFLVSQVMATALAVALVMAFYRERRAIEEGLKREAQRLLRLQGEAIAAAANAIFITDRSGRIEWSNEAFTRLSGWGAVEAKGRGARRLLMGKERDSRLDDALGSSRPWRGELSLRRKDGTLYVVDQTVAPIIGDDGRVAHFVVVQEDVTERRHAEERIRFLSNHDQLTALPNRLLFRERLQRTVARARAERGELAVLFIDLDDFSRYNDVLGHDGGDRLLLQVVERVMMAARGAEVVARVGGDEFALLMLGGADLAETTAQAVLEAMQGAYDIDGSDVHVGGCVGITVFPSDGGDADVLMKNADIAMYRAIHEAQGGYCFFAPTMHDELERRRGIEADLRRAVARDELVLYYQPVVEIAGRRILGFEALLRWNRGGAGLVAPAEFIHLAEANGLIVPIGEWVLREACRQAREWADAGLAEVPVAVNLSAVQLLRQDLPLLIRGALTETRLPAARLELELTETTVMADASAALRTLGEVSAQGVALAVDDFGTGYSSLERLKRFPVGKLKIDQSFVRDLAEDDSDAAIARAIISMGHALGLMVVAEGVETEAQLAILAAQGCDAVQGFLFSPPVSATEAAELLRRGRFSQARS
ncbi:bifunctional diguanylate cyclase/phosphodiesterase [Magnetospirillum sp. UT-4]|uniref:putative bifunctional diguanylate cyclase/phosphodiesterase n=1 Tax=Magnetospirillum sp. UT-4 TaxID=2681467 RepID=UPI00137CB5E4|nr:GGDEF and EAL domain-containing protein [Magnetospirillum sp. UT-4]CAA7615248.1 Sensory box/GGDEF family protein [Magnetospirillum sp. UT-4]